MGKVVICVICLGLANFAVAALHADPHYQSALGTTWSQAWAVLIYHFIWTKD
jgi:hypothetical protein